MSTPELAACSARLSAEAAAASQRGDHLSAVALLAQAVAGDAANRLLHSNLGVALVRAGRVDEAIEAYRTALRLEPGHGPTLGKLGRALSEAGRHQEALEALHQASELAPSDADTANALGAALANAGRIDQARRAFTRAVALDPEFTEAWANLGRLEANAGRWEQAAPAFAQAGLDYEHGVALGKLGRHEQALAAYERARSQPGGASDARVWNNLGHTLAALGRHQEAEAALLEALRRHPNYVDARYNLGVTLQALGRDAEARRAYQLVIAAAGGHADALNNLGGLCLSEARPELAVPLYERALGANQSHPEARWNLGLAQLSCGDFERGWANYEQRPVARRFDPGRAWTPQTNPAGRTVLLWCEQGLGDAIQFLRYGAVLAARGARVMVECPARLAPLVRLGFAQVIERGGGPGSPLPDFDVHVSAMSLPAFLGTRLDSIPPPGPAYTLPEASCLGWREQLEALAPRGSGRLRTGIVWGGSPENKKGLSRSMPFAALAGPLSARSDLALVSLQHGPQTAEAAGSEGAVAQWPQQDLVDTAALVAELDLVITVDTLMAHLAGTIGRRVALLLPFAADWRWMQSRADSPWYPNMRLYRQPAPGDWGSAVSALAADLDAGRFH